MNKQIRRLGIALLVCYLALFLQLNRIQVLDADRLNNDPYNGRQAQREYNRARGQILSADGAVLARSESIPEEEDAFYRKRRVYPERELFGHITGYFSFNYGFTGVEKQYNDDLSGNSLAVQVNSLQDLLVANNENVGNVTLSIRKDVQEEARNALGEREGSVVLLDLKSGAIEALWSYPSFDPTAISSTDRDQMESAWNLYNVDPRKPLLAHTFQERYFPGSTFKLVTAGTGLQTGKVKPTDQFPAVTSYTPPQTTRPISNFGGGVCGGDFFTIIANSCNAAFAEMGQATIGPVDMVKGAESFGFNQALPIDLPAPASSNFPTDVIGTPNPPKLAMSSIGQNDVAATPLQMAMVASAAANGGTIMKPTVMREVRTSEGRVAKSAAPEPWVTPLSPDNAAIMKQAMLDVVSRGSGTGLQIPGMEVGGKTGTAQLGDEQGRVHTWIVGFAGPPGNPRYAFAVVVLNQPSQNEFTGGQISAPIAKRVLEFALSR